MNDNKNALKSNFGGKGWWVILYCAILFFYQSSFLAAGANIFPNLFAEQLGANPAELLAYYSPAGFVGILGGLVFGQLVAKKGAKFAMLISLACGGALLMINGFVGSAMQYLIVICLLTFMITGFGSIVTNTLLTNWFPSKKGLAMGWSTMGLVFGTLILVPVVNWLLTLTSLQGVFIIFGISMLVVAAIGFFTIRNTPEEAGCYPDNDASSSELAKDFAERMKNYKSPYTFRALFRDKNMWMISIGFGLQWLVVMGIVSQLVPYMISLGAPPPEAVRAMSYFAMIGIPGSYVWGWVDQKIGTRNTGLIYAVWHIVLLIVLYFSQSYTLSYIAVLLAGFGNGGIGNLVPSMIGTSYGRLDFPYVSRLATALVTGIRSCAFLVMALGLSMGGLRISYVLLLGIAVVSVPFIWGAKKVYAPAGVSAES